MKRKGFTLVELLAVIVILAVISIITIPMIGSVIEDSRKKALEQSVYGLVEAARYYAIYNDETHVVFGEKATKDPKEILDYSGEIEAEGDLYIDKDGNISLCFMNESYYVYKNYNSGVVIGNRSEDSCKARYDELTNKYIAYLESEGEGSNVYDKEYINNLEDSLQGQITENADSITKLQSDLSDYALQSDIQTLADFVTKNTDDIDKNTTDITNLNNNLANVTLDNSTVLVAESQVPHDSLVSITIPNIQNYNMIMLKIYGDLNLGGYTLMIPKASYGDSIPFSVDTSGMNDVYNIKSYGYVGQGTINIRRTVIAGWPNMQIRVIGYK